MSTHSYLTEKNTSLSLSLSFPPHRYTCDLYACTSTSRNLLRMRAALFLNAVTIRQCVSTSNGWILSQEVLQKLLTANYLFHASLNCNMAQVMHAVQWDTFWCWKLSYDLAKGLLKRLCHRAYCVGRSDPNYTSFLVPGVIGNRSTCVAHAHLTRKTKHVALAKVGPHLHRPSPDIVTTADINIWRWGSSAWHALYILCMCVYIKIFKISSDQRCASKVGKVKTFAVMAHPRLLGRQVLERWAAFACVRWLRKLNTKWLGFNMLLHL